MVAPFTTGQELSAADLNDAMEIGKVMLDTGPITANSLTWNTAAKITTGLSGIFAGAVLGATYRIDVTAHGGNNTTGGYATMGAMVKAGGAAGAADFQVSGTSVFVPAGGAAVNCSHHGLFVASAAGTWGVNVMGWIGLGGGVGSMVGAAGTFINRMTVTRVA